MKSLQSSSANYSGSSLQRAGLLSTFAFDVLLPTIAASRLGGGGGDDVEGQWTEAVYSDLRPKLANLRARVPNLVAAEQQVEFHFGLRGLTESLKFYFDRHPERPVRPGTPPLSLMYSHAIRLIDKNLKSIQELATFHTQPWDGAKGTPSRTRKGAPEGDTPTDTTPTDTTSVGTQPGTPLTDRLTERLAYDWDCCSEALKNTDGLTRLEVRCCVEADLQRCAELMDVLLASNDSAMAATDKRLNLTKRLMDPSQSGLSRLILLAPEEFDLDYAALIDEFMTKHLAPYCDWGVALPQALAMAMAVIRHGRAKPAWVEYHEQNLLKLLTTGMSRKTGREKLVMNDSTMLRENLLAYVAATHKDLHRAGYHASHDIRLFLFEIADSSNNLFDELDSRFITETAKLFSPEGYRKLNSQDPAIDYRTGRPRRRRTTGRPRRRRTTTIGHDDPMMILPPPPAFQDDQVVPTAEPTDERDIRTAIKASIDAMMNSNVKSDRERRIILSEIAKRSSAIREQSQASSITSPQGPQAPEPTPQLTAAAEPASATTPTSRSTDVFPRSDVTCLASSPNDSDEDLFIFPWLLPRGEVPVRRIQRERELVEAESAGDREIQASSLSTRPETPPPPYHSDPEVLSELTTKK